MKTKKMIIVAAIAIAAATLTAFTVMPKTNHPDEPEKTTTSQDNVVPNENEEDAGTLCPCSQLRCAICDGPVVWKSEAYVKVRKTCSQCKGKGYLTDYNGKPYNCPNPYCKDGIHVEYGSGCYCGHCSEGFKQPNDC